MSNPYEQLSDKIDYDAQFDAGEDHVEEFDEVQRMVDQQIIGSKTPQSKSLDDFLSNIRLHTEKGDPKMNLWEQGGKYRKIKLEQPNDAQLVFHLINQARKAGARSFWTEKQRATREHDQDPAQLFIDLDIYQTESESLLNDRHIHKLQTYLSDLIKKLFTPVEEQKGDFTIFSSATRKPVMKWDEKRKKYKDGLHIYISVRLTRNAKRFLIQQILEEKIMTKVFGKDYEDPESLLDTQCCHVPPLLYGSVKADSTGDPYKLWVVYQWVVEEDGTWVVTKDEHFTKSDHVLNFVLELSCNWEGKVIKKLNWVPREEFQDRVMLLDRKNKHSSEEENQGLLDDINHLLISDPDADYLKSVLDCLKPQRYNNRKLWFKVLYALLRGGNERYIPLAKWFSRKSNKYDDDGFMKAVTEVLNGRDYKLDIESLYHWASKDSPEKFRTCNDRSCFILMSRYVFDSITDGRLGHAHFAELVWLFLKNKYRTDYEGSNKRIWIEFKFPQDPHERGQVYKWCKIATPDSLDMYLHRKLSLLCDKMVKYITKKIKENTDKIVEALGKKLDCHQEKSLKQYYTQILKNFKSSARGLWADGFKKGVIKQSEPVFSCPGFIKSLDQGMMDLGVGNGILQMSWDGKLPKLIKSFNTCRVSRFTSTPYKQFDPRDPLTRKLMKGLRSMHLDNETDAHEYKMSMKAASIDYRPRETIAFLFNGPGSGGKSFEFELHGATMGDQYHTSMPIQMLIASKEGDGETPSSFMMRLEAARSAHYEEGPACAILYMPKLKRITGCSSMPARELHEKARIIKSRCYHFILSNHDFMVLNHEEAVWRRLRYYKQSIIFKDELKIDYNNPFHRLMDRSFNSQFIEDEATRSAYLSILVFYHMKLMWKWGGVIDHVPHPTIDRHTLEFRNRQDTLNRFITERIVYSPEQTEETPLERVVDIYCQWYNANIKDIRHFKKDIFTQISDSALKKVIEQNVYGSYLKDGLRVIETGDEKRDGETPFVTNVKEEKETDYKYVFPDETPDEYLDRVEHEWSEMLSRESVEKIDLSKTYDYESDDPDQESDDDADDARRPIQVAEPLEDDIMILSEEYEEEAQTDPGQYDNLRKKMMEFVI